MVRVVPVFRLAVIASVFCAGLGESAAAEAEAPGRRREVYSGFDYTGSGIASYSAFVWSPFSSVADQGFRLRIGSLTSLYGETQANVFTRGFRARALRSEGDISAGYQFHAGEWWLKAYAGAALRTNVKTWRDYDVSRQGQDWGGKGIVEAWRPLSERSWLALSTAWTGIDNTQSANAKAGYDFARFDKGIRLAAGAEAAFSRDDLQRYARLTVHNEAENFVRGGLFLNARYRTHDLTVSGGLAEGSGDREPRPYATLTYGRQF